MRRMENLQNLEMAPPLETIEADVLSVPKRRALPANASYGDMGSLRWLAELCGLPPTNAYPSLASALLDDPALVGPATAYIAWWIRHPDPGSRFDQAIRHLSQMPDAALVPALRNLGYDGLLYLRRDDIVGHVFFQRNGMDLCAFSASVSECSRGGKFWATVLMEFVAFASQLPDVTRARVGG